MKTLRKLRLNWNSLIKTAFMLSLITIAFLIGAVTREFNTFPHPILDSVYRDARSAITSIRGQIDPSSNWWYVEETDLTTNVTVIEPKALNDGLSLVTSFVENNRLAIRVIDIHGNLVHDWRVDWFELWPNPTHLDRSESDYPRQRPGTHIHGTQLLENGDIVFNFEYLGLIRLDVCGEVVWRLPYRTHHSIHLDENGNLWVPGAINHYSTRPDSPKDVPLYREQTILEVSPAGEILTELSLIDILVENDLKGLLYMSAPADRSVRVVDPLHLNDVETFPSTMESGVFEAGDIMVSLRNNNTVLVLRPPNMDVIQLSVGEYVRQHDPDFIDGNTISVFDNHNLSPRESRIMIKSFSDNDSYVYYGVDEAQSFFTSRMGKHEWLPNGNMLITESEAGRAFEIDPEGNIVWEFVNVLADGHIALVEEVSRLPEQFTAAYFAEKTRDCGNPAIP